MSGSTGTPAGPLAEEGVTVQDDRISITNGGSNQSLNGITSEVDNVQPEYSKCHMYIDAHNHSMGQQSCINGYGFHFKEANDWNVVAEWGLVCNRQ